MRRSPSPGLLAFGALAVATVAAFFVTQHLKVSTPLIAGDPHPTPAVIAPGSRACRGASASAKFSFYLLHRADDVAVYVVDGTGTILRTLASGRHMRRGVRVPDGNFPWNGRMDDGRIAPDGVYYFRIALLRQGRTIELTKSPVTVRRRPPQPVVTAVTPQLIPSRSAPLVSIAYRGNQTRSATVLIYRTDLPGGPKLLDTFHTQWNHSSTVWRERIRHGVPPAGTYLMGMQVTDGACNTGQFPPRLPPPPGTTPNAGLTVRYLAAQPPLIPVAAGSPVTVYVDSRGRPYRWTLQRVGAPRPALTGTGHGFALRLHLPAQGAGLYVLSLRSGIHATSVPLVASAPAQRSPRVLVVLPGLTWQGENLLDDDGDGMPNTLPTYGPVSLRRPLAHGLPAAFADQSALPAFLDRMHLPYDLTTDLGLLGGTGPALASHRLVVLDGPMRWLPPSVSTSLRSFVHGGGRVLALGPGSLRSSVTVRGMLAGPATTPTALDIFGAHFGAPVHGSGQLIGVVQDQLGIFSGTPGAFSGYRDFEPIITASSGPPASAAGLMGGAAAIAGFHLGGGTVIEIPIAGFASSLGRNVGAQELMTHLWQMLGR